MPKGNIESLAFLLGAPPAMKQGNDAKGEGEDDNESAVDKAQESAASLMMDAIASSDAKAFAMALKDFLELL